MKNSRTIQFFTISPRCSNDDSEDVEVAVEALGRIVADADYFLDSCDWDEQDHHCSKDRQIVLDGLNELHIH
jgi:hypothetical protein